MSTGPSRKEQRRQAALREMERRSVEAEEAAVADAADLDWGTGSLLSTSLRNNLLRLGARPDSPTASTAIEILTQQIRWPESPFRSSARRYREMHCGSDHMTDLEIADCVRWCHDFKFSCNGGFYPDWQTDFAGTDPQLFFPLGADSHYFYFVGPNTRDQNDPLVYNVDHETTEDTPRNRQGTTVTEFLSLLTAA